MKQHSPTPKPDEIVPPCEIGIDPEDYHADPCPAPSLNSGVASLLFHRSPLHAAAAHPRLPGSVEDKNSAKRDYGSAFHSLLLGVGREPVDIGFDTMRTNAAKAAYEQAQEDRKTPLTSPDFEKLHAAVEAARTLILDSEIGHTFAHGRPERTLLWEEGGYWFRALLDMIAADSGMIIDVKTTSTSAEPEQWMKHVINMGYDMQVGHYRRAARAVHDFDARFVWIVIESEAPGAVSLVEAPQALLHIADERSNIAARRWKQCMSRNYWPGYPKKIVEPDLPGWFAMRHEDTVAHQEAISTDRLLQGG